ncbi:MAG: hypothetical protein IH598_00940 [Bacteroidales bacterium]|nr:hypothetical protein [Bacteroidales bacterium]
MDKEKIEKHLHKTVENIKQYVDLKTELFSLIVIERMAKVLSRVSVLMILTMLLFFFLLFVSLALVGWLGSLTGSESLGYIIIAVFYLIIGVILYMLRKQIFLDPLLKGIIGIFEEEEEDLLNKNSNPAEDEKDED